MAKHLAQTEKKKRPEKSAKSDRLPEIKLPKIKLPKAKLPEVKLPEIKLPKRPAEPAREAQRGDPFRDTMLNKTLDRRFNPSDFILTGFALLFLIAAYFLPTSGPVRLLTFLVPFLLAGYSYLYEAFQEAFMGIVLGRELIVTLAALMALCAGAWFGAAAIMICLKAGDLALAYVESLQSGKIKELYALRPEKARLCGAETPARSRPPSSRREMRSRWTPERRSLPTA